MEETGMLEAVARGKFDSGVESTVVKKSGAANQPADRWIPRRDCFALHDALATFA
jgi:hypothetical protein